MAIFSVIFDSIRIFVGLPTFWYGADIWFEIKYP